MPTDTNPSGAEPGTGSDEPIPAASDNEVIEDTARLAREGRKELESDPREPKQIDR